MNPLLSFAGLPCQVTPWGNVAGLDLTTDKNV
jgi:quinoprotein glucose dehydrogenase